MYRMGNRRSVVGVGTVVCALFAMGVLLNGSIAFGEDRVKVNKAFISVSMPNEHGIVTVKGIRGAISNPADVSLRLENLVTKQRVPTVVKEDGSFIDKIEAEAGVKVRVFARKAGGNQSYGRFTVPGAVVTPPIQETSAPMQSLPQGVPDATVAGTMVENEGGAVVAGLEGLSTLQRAPRSPVERLQHGDMASPAGQVNVLIVVMDAESGSILASQSMAGLTRGRVPTEEKASEIAKRIVRRCLAVLRTELRPIPVASRAGAVRTSHNETVSPDPAVEPATTAIAEKDAPTASQNNQE